MNVSEVPSPATKKRGPLFWILIGVASFVVLIVITFGAVGYFGLRALERTTGLDIETIKNHPNFAANKMQIVANPDNEILSENIDTGEIRFRNKKTGEEFVGKTDPATRHLTIVPVSPAPETK